MEKPEEILEHIYKEILENKELSLAQKQLALQLIVLACQSRIENCKEELEKFKDLKIKTEKLMEDLK